MYALPGQTLAMAERDLERAFALAPAHLKHCGALDAGEGSELFEPLRGQDHSQ